LVVAAERLAADFPFGPEEIAEISEKASIAVTDKTV
jgi:hypothetical protein